MALKEKIELVICGHFGTALSCELGQPWCPRLVQVNLLDPSSSNVQHLCPWQGSVNLAHAVLRQTRIRFLNALVFKCTNTKSPQSKTSGTGKSDCFYLCCKILENSISAFIGSLLYIQ